MIFYVSLYILSHFEVDKILNNKTKLYKYLITDTFSFNIYILLTSYKLLFNTLCVILRFLNFPFYS